MADINFSEQLAQLKSGAIDSIQVTPETFDAFQAAFMDFESRKRVVGTAGQNGVITYRFAQD